MIYKGVCVYEQACFGEAGSNVELRWEEHENICNDSKPARHLKEYLSHNFSWKILLATPTNKRIRRIFKTS